MDWLKSLAPTLSTLITGSPLAGMAASMIAEKLGLSESTVEAVQGALNGNALTSEQIASLKLAEVDMKKFMADNGLKLEELAAGDRKDARARDVEYLKNNKRNIRADVLAYGALFAFVAAGVALFFANMPTQNRELLVYLLGALTVIVKDIYGFEFSTTRDSQKKTDLLAQAEPIK